MLGAAWPYIGVRRHAQVMALGTLGRGRMLFLGIVYFLKIFAKYLIFLIILNLITHA
jgi:hypothetical protein